MKGPVAHLLQTDPVTGLCRHRAAVSRAARPVMRMRWQESRQVPSKPPGAGQRWFSVWTSLLAQCVLYCCWTVQPSQGTSVWSWCRFSLYLCFPLVGHPPVSLICFTLFPFFFFVSCFSCSLCTPVFLFVFSTVSIPLSHLNSLLPKRFRSRWRRLKRERTLLRPPDPQPREPPVSHEKSSLRPFFLSLLFFSFTLSLSFSFLRFFFSLSLSLQYLIWVLYLNPFLSLLVLTCSSSVRKCPLRSYLYSDVGHRNTFINLLSAIIHTKGCWYRDSLDEVAVQRTFFFFFLIGLITAISYHVFLLVADRNG